MNRAAIIAKIKAMLTLKENTDFNGEAENAARMIDILCAKYGINVSTDLIPEVLDEVFSTFKRMPKEDGILLNAVATFYDALAYVNQGTSFKIIGTEAQQIQVQLYFEYLKEAMERDCNTAYAAEKVLADMMCNPLPRRTFKNEFRYSYVVNVSQRLREMKENENRIHEDAEHTKNALALRKFTKARRTTGRSGPGTLAGSSAGQTVSLNKQAGAGASQRALMGR
jgi:hypothetical protein